VIAKAPGKLVLSGAYAVLFGAPAIVTAVDRYVTTDSSRAADFVTPEVLAALPANVPAPAFDASELRSEFGKLGLGSSAAILVASLGALEPEPPTAEALAQLTRRALLAHRAAQGGGSGIDVLASVQGGTLVVRTQTEAELPGFKAVTLPPGLHWSVWFSGRSTSTSAMIAQVRQFRSMDRLRFDSILTPLSQAAEDAARAIEVNQASDLFEALRAQGSQLQLLGEAADIDIVTRDTLELDRLAEAEGALCMPSGAGGGDVMLRVGATEPGVQFVELAQALGFVRLPLVLGAPGLHFPQARGRAT